MGTQPTTPADIDRLSEVEGVTCIFNTQQDKDMEYWKVDFEAVKQRVEAGRGEEDEEDELTLNPR